MRRMMSSRASSGMVLCSSMSPAQPPTVQGFAYVQRLQQRGAGIDASGPLSIFAALLFAASGPCPAGLRSLASDLPAALSGQFLGAGAPSLRTTYLATHSSE